LGVLTRTADALPGFGIVAAVLGIVITMGSIDGPVDEIGEKVGAALVGTFLGILLSYGFFAPLAVRMEFLGAAELAFFRTIAAAIQGFANDLPPKVAVEQACRGVMSEMRPNRAELDELFAAVDAS
jgi:chemotaxis protein MotA